MTPKEKAKELVEKMYVVHSHSASDITYYFVKECALIAINEMIEEISKWAGGDFIEWEKERWKYLQQIKQEIEKL